MRPALFAALLLGYLMAAAPAVPVDTGPDRSGDSAAIRQLAAGLDAAWNRRDAAALAGLFLDDADFQWHTGELLEDKKQIEEYFGTVVFKQMPPEFRHLTTTRRLHFLGPDTAIGDGTIVVAREGAGENEAPYLNVRFTCVGRKDGGRWLIAAVRLMRAE